MGDFVDAFRELRVEWFDSQLKRRAHEREWETPEQASERDAINLELKLEYAVQTEVIINGGAATVAPMCANDLHD